MNNLKIGDKVVIHKIVDETKHCPICGLYFNDEMNKYEDKKYEITDILSKDSLRSIYSLDKESWEFCEHWLTKSNKISLKRILK